MGNLPGTLSSVQPRGHKAGARSLTNKARWIIAITINCSRGLRAQSSRAWQRQENFHASWLPFEGPSLHHSPRIRIPPRPTAHFNNYCRPHVDMDKDLDKDKDMDTDTDADADTEFESESELVMCSIFRILHIRRPERSKAKAGLNGHLPAIIILNNIYKSLSCPAHTASRIARIPGSQMGGWARGLHKNLPP